MTLPSGTKLGPYEVQSSLGAGGMGEVYRARDTRLQRTVAIKILPESLSSDRDRLERFQQEARVLSVLNHPNLMASALVRRAAEWNRRRDFGCQCRDRRAKTLNPLLTHG